jgi:hypothetical protein
MHEIYSDSELLGVLNEAGLWLVRGGRTEVLCLAIDLRSALVRASEHVAVADVVLAIVKSPNNQVMILPEQIDRLCGHMRFAA